ncbi:hypothetical protein GCM10008949_29870 [Deinococcus humi]|nr:hypothetical protein GCM10008949_29870 [Deinococcus humi]
MSAKTVIRLAADVSGTQTFPAHVPVSGMPLTFAGASLSGKQPELFRGPSFQGWGVANVLTRVNPPKAYLTDPLLQT